MLKIVEMRFGSHLYGTDTPNSDLDIKGVFIPSVEDILLNRIPKSITENTKKTSDVKNTCDDVDKEFYSIHYFLKLACEGETVALDMLHVNPENIIYSHPVWHQLQLLRSTFYTKSLKSFVGYARKQAAKYGIKGSRLNSSKLVYDWLKGRNNDRLIDCWNDLPTPEHVYKLEKNLHSGLREYQIAGKKFQETCRIEYVLPILKRFIDEYGHRAKQAANNEGIDWKAVSHAFRAAYQTKSIFLNGDIIFPLAEADFLKQVKNGELDFVNVVSPKLEELMDEIEYLSSQSNLPEKVDYKFWNQWLINTIRLWYEGYY